MNMPKPSSHRRQHTAPANLHSRHKCTHAPIDPPITDNKLAICKMLTRRVWFHLTHPLSIDDSIAAFVCTLLSVSVYPLQQSPSTTKGNIVCTPLVHLHVLKDITDGFVTDTITLYRRKLGREVKRKGGGRDQLSLDSHNIICRTEKTISESITMAAGVIEGNHHCG